MTPSRSFSDNRYWIVPAIAILFCATAWHFSRIPEQVVLHELRPLINAATPPPTADQCVSCHREITNQFLLTGHARSLWHGDDPEVVEHFANQTYRWTPEGPVFRYVTDARGLWLTQEGSDLRLRVDWVMGSGGHSQGAISLVNNPSGKTEILEHLLAWFPQVGIAPALGNESKIPATHGIASMAGWQENPNAKDCLGCHSSHVPLDQASQILSQSVVGTVGCVRCHADAASHVAQNGSVDAFRERWSKLSPQEVVHRCGECHRRSNETDPRDLNSDHLHIVRFASVGLAQSRCFQSQDSEAATALKVRLDCLSCHDMHRPLGQETARAQQVCQSCHAAEKNFAKPCPSQLPASNCTSCHMPVIDTDPHMHFTDHWIRVHKPKD